jgi:hypothetical protein
MSWNRNVVAAEAILSEVSDGNYTVVRDPWRMDAEMRQVLAVCTDEVMRAAIVKARMDVDVCPRCLWDHGEEWPPRVRLAGFRCMACGWRASRRQVSVLGNGLLGAVRRHQKRQASEQAARLLGATRKGGAARGRDSDDARIGMEDWTSRPEAAPEVLDILAAIERFSWGGLLVAWLAMVALFFGVAGGAQPDDAPWGDLDAGLVRLEAVSAMAPASAQGIPGEGALEESVRVERVPVERVPSAGGSAPPVGTKPDALPAFLAPTMPFWLFAPHARP